jgi:hypothetical protein
MLLTVADTATLGGDLLGGAALPAQHVARDAQDLIGRRGKYMGEPPPLTVGYCAIITSTTAQTIVQPLPLFAKRPE